MFKRKWLRGLIKTNASDYLNSLQGEKVVIYSNRAVASLTLNKESTIMVNIHDITKSIELIEKRFDKFKNSEYIVAIGGGTAMDIAKYIAYKLNKKLISVPTMLSTNAYSTDKTCLFKGEHKITLDAKIADVIVFDEEVLEKATNLNSLGLFDVFSIHTALYDWDVAIKYNNEKSHKCYNMAKRLLRKTIKFCNKNTLHKIQHSTKKIYKLVYYSGEVTNIYGSGRPESGSEHIFAKELEYRVENLPHGLAVANGIIIMSILQNNISLELINLLHKLQLNELNSEYKIIPELLTSVLKTVKPREGRYTIIDRVALSNKKVEEVMKKYNELVNQQN